MAKNRIVNSVCGVHLNSTPLYTVEPQEGHELSRTRAIRFTDPEEAQIQEFLFNNPFFDFSTLAKLAITAFINDPKLEVRPVSPGLGSYPSIKLGKRKDHARSDNA